MLLVLNPNFTSEIALYIYLIFDPPSSDVSIHHYAKQRIVIYDYGLSRQGEKSFIQTGLQM